MFAFGVAGLRLRVCWWLVILVSRCCGVLLVLCLVFAARLLCLDFALFCLILRVWFVILVWLVVSIYCGLGCSLRGGLC